MTGPNNLIPGQYQIEDLIIGKGTPYKINSFEIAAYGVQAGDFQQPQMDQNFFGQDQHIPGPITITLELLQNRWTHKVVPGAKLISADLGKLQRIWRGDDIRNEWGAQQLLYYAGNDGVQKVLYGRTGKFQYPRFNEKTDGYECALEYRRTDNFAYSAREYGFSFIPNQLPIPVTVGTLGDAPSWIKMFLQGPMQDVQITFGDVSFELDWNIPAGKILEINGYPGFRRCVDSDGFNRRQSLVGTTPYLDRLKFNFNQTPTIQCIAINTTSASKGIIMWRDAYQVIS